MRETHPTSTARSGYRHTDAIYRGRHADIQPYKASRIVWCRQCGFRCNLDRDARGVGVFSGETLTDGNEATNGGFEDWTLGAPDDWTVSGSVSEETTLIDLTSINETVSSSSCKIVRAGSDISLNQAMGTPSDFNSNRIYIRARVKSTVKDIIRLKVTVNSTDYYSSYNRGQQTYEDLSTIIKCPSTVSSLTLYILADSEDGTAYVDNVSIMRSGSSTTASFAAGCPLCTSYNYY